MIVCCSRRCISSVSFFQKFIGGRYLISLGIDGCDRLDLFFLYFLFFFGSLALRADGAVRGSDGQLSFVTNGNFLVFAGVQNLEDVLAKALILGLVDLAGLKQEFNFLELVEIEQTFLFQSVVL